jgi:hypothetical protein
MGSGRFDSNAYATRSASFSGKSTDEVFRSRGMNATLDPKGAKLRESRDSVDNPRSTAIIVALDVTGSMGILADQMVRSGLGVLFTSILDKKPVPDPHIMFMAIGDAHCDRAPLQVSQFEADNRIVEQLADIYIEKGGGGNCSESYNLPWYFAAAHTDIDCHKVRGKKGFLFTVGDEEAPEALTQDQLQRFVDAQAPRGLSNAEMLAAVRAKYHVFHVIVEQGDYARRHLDAVVNSWNSLLGQSVLRLADHTKLAEVIVETIAIVEGRSSSSTDLVVRKATASLLPAVA